MTANVRGRGRPTKYRPDYPRQAEQLARLGAADADLAEAFEVSAMTIWRWRMAYPEFCYALKEGKDAFDDRVERSLAMRAVGYSYDAEKIFYQNGKVIRVPYREHVPPDVTACIFWLKNRRPEQWR